MHLQNNVAKNYLYLYLFEELVACARMLLLRPDPGSASEGGRSRPETPQGNTQVSLKTQTCERKSSSRARDSA